MLRHDWTLGEVRAIHNLPLPDLIFRAQTAHRQYHDPTSVQGCALLSIKTGHCPEDCAYCPQSARYDTGLVAEDLRRVDETLAIARQAHENGATRFCMGAAWRQAPDGPEFDRVVEMVRGVRELGMEACCTLGMLSQQQADRLAEAGLTAYNHNLDTSPEFYGEIITTRTYQERLDTLARVRASGVTICCGGIIGMGETLDNRLGLILQLARQEPHPESVPINSLVRVSGTPLDSAPPVSPLDFARMIATTRIVMPASIVRLSAGRLELSDEGQALCLLAGANSLFLGDRLLTTPNPGSSDDERLLARMGMTLSSEPLTTSPSVP